MKYQSTNLPIENEFPKLVRDKVPEIIKKETGKEALIKFVVDDEEFFEYLLQKLVEEAVEAHYSIKAENLEEELADILEIIYAIMELKKLPMESIEKIRKEKQEKRGGFKKRLTILSKPK